MPDGTFTKTYEGYSQGTTNGMTDKGGNAFGNNSAAIAIRNKVFNINGDGSKIRMPLPSPINVSNAKGDNVGTAISFEIEPNTAPKAKGFLRRLYDANGKDLGLDIGDHQFHVYYIEIDSNDLPNTYNENKPDNDLGISKDENAVDENAGNRGAPETICKDGTTRKTAIGTTNGDAKGGSGTKVVLKR
jgi:hypothetical protein